MATIEDICVGALKKLGAIDADETPSANDAGYCKDELNDMLSEMTAQQIYLNWTPLGLHEAFPLEDKHVGGIKAMLAVRISPAFGGDGMISGVLIKQANEGYSRLWGDYHRPDELSVDDGLSSNPGFWTYGLGNVNG